MYDNRDNVFSYVKDIFSILHKYSSEGYLTSYLETGILPNKTAWKKALSPNSSVMKDINGPIKHFTIRTLQD